MKNRRVLWAYVFGVILLLPYMRIYFTCPAPEVLDRMANYYRERATGGDNIFLAQSWMETRMMDWSRFGMLVPIRKNEFLNPPADRGFQVWLLDYGNYFSVNRPRIEKLYRVAAYHREGDLRAYVLVPLNRS